MNGKSKYSQFDSKKVKSVDTNETHLFAGIISFFTKRNILIIILVVVIGIFAMRTIGLMYNDQQKAKVTPIVNNTTHNNTTHVNTTVEKISNDNTNHESQDSNSEPLEFNGKTHSQNFAEARASAQSNGVSDEQLNQLLLKEERDGGRV